MWHPVRSTPWIPEPGPDRPYRVAVTSEADEDPDERPRVRRNRAHKRRFRVIWLISGAVVVVLAIWAATSVGKRPAFEQGSTPSVSSTSTAPEETPDSTDVEAPPTPDDSGTTFTNDAPVLASAGCAADDPERTVPDAELAVDGSVLARYSIAAPDIGEPVPLLALVSEPGLPVSELADTSALFDVNAEWVHVGVDPLTDAEQLGGTGIPQLLEDTTTRYCVDLSRVFLVGFGEGGRSVGVAACSAARLVTGVVMVAGWTEPSCSSNPRVAVRIVGAEDDPTTDTGTALDEVGGAWARSVGAGEQTVDGRDEDTLVRVWPGPGGVTVETTATISGAHTWTVAASLATGSFLANTARSID